MDRLPLRLLKKHGVLHERPDQTRMRTGIHPITQIFFLLPATIWYGAVGPQQALPPHGKAT